MVIESQINRHLHTPRVEFARQFAAPPALVFQAWTEPHHLRHWSGPRSVELVECQIDLRIGGRYEFIHRDPHGRLLRSHGVFCEIERPSRLVRTYVYEQWPHEVAVEEMTFSPAGLGTLVVDRSTFTSPELRDFYVQSGIEDGIREANERLDDWLEIVQRAQRHETDPTYLRSWI